jgi:hypothetical protein
MHVNPTYLPILVKTLDRVGMIDDCDVLTKFLNSNCDQAMLFYHIVGNVGVDINNILGALAANLNWLLELVRSRHVIFNVTNDCV